MNSLTTKVLVVILSLLVLTIIGRQVVYKMMNNTHKTINAELCDDKVCISFKGVIVRNEKVIEYNGKGIPEYNFKDGSKVSVDTIIADVYSSEEDLLSNRKSKDCLKQAELLEKSQRLGIAKFVQPGLLFNKVDTEYRNLMTCLNEDNYKEISDVKDNLFFNLSLYNIITKLSKNYNETISSLKMDANKYESASEIVETIKSSDNGYFVSNCDGFENEWNFETLNDKTEKDINDVIDCNGKKEVSSNAIGKILDSSSCKIVAIIENNEKIKEKKNFKVMLNNSNILCDVKVESIKDADEEGKSILILSCDWINKDLIKSKVQLFDLIIDDYNGIKIPRNAIRFKDGVRGVYVFRNKIEFKKIDVTYEGDDFVISKNTSDDDYVLNNDQILMEAVSSKDESNDEKSS